MTPVPSGFILRVMATTREAAVVIGASMGGLASAAVLASHFEQVVVLDRETGLDTEGPRKGVPQGAHAHGLLAAGLRGLEELFPGLTADLATAGGQPGDVQRDVRWVLDGEPLASGESGLRGITIA